MDIRTARTAGMKLLAHSPTPALDTDCLLQHILGTTRTWLMAHSDASLLPEQQTQFDDAIRRRQTGLPVAYITGHKEFYGLDFTVTPDVLIPKPDTELLVEHALEELRVSAVSFTADAPYRIADVCTGSGCIGISVLHESPVSVRQLRAVLTDISPAALTVARANARHLLAADASACLSFAQGDLLDSLSGTDTAADRPFNLILSNPPYIPAGEVTELLKDGRSEPRLALDGDAGNAASADGLAIIRRLIPQALGHLAENGLFLVETGEYNAEKTAALMRTAGFRNVETFRDLAGQLRLTQGRR